MADLHVFIDTNVWLSFYSFTNDDLEELRKLTALIKSGKLKLYIDQQLSDEFYRNREVKLQHSLNEFEKKSVPKGLPRYMRDYDQAKDYEEAIAKFEKARNDLITRARNEAAEKNLAADKIFSEILSASPATPVDGDLISAALNRRLVGNPPGKYPSLGDQIHWESLLIQVPNGSELHIVSKDGDFESALTDGRINAFLEDEWKSKKGANVVLHTELRPFLNSKFPTIKLAVDVEKRVAIDRLINSGLFSATHKAIAELAVYEEGLTWPEVDEILTAGIKNSQIRRIGSDLDVRLFYEGLIEKFDDKIDAERKANLLNYFKKDEWDVNPAEFDIEDEEYPF